MKATNKRRNRTLLLAVLLLLISSLVYFLCNRKSRDVLHATIQGETTLQAGNITMKVWDNNTEDGDTISIYFDEKLIKDSLLILNDPDTLPLGKLKPGEYLLKVKAISEGLSAPATASISLNNGKEEKEFVMNSYIDSSAAWKVIIQ